MAESRSSSSTVDPPSLLVFSGGTGFNGVVEELKKLTTRVAHVLPVSDDGGSTAEIVRVLGGPAVGDIRSRCLRLSDESTSEALAVRRLLGHRLPIDAHKAKKDWYDIVEGDHSLWNGVSRPYSETIRAFLIYFQNEILRRPNERFCFSNGSIGNFFFAGARIFFQSLDAAIFLFSRVSEIPCDSLALPVISTNDRLTLGCELQDGTIIRGQNEISHPTNGTMQIVDKKISMSIVLALILYCEPICGQTNVLVYIGICSLMGSLTVMSIKAVGIAIKLTLEGISQIWYPETWFFVMVASICVVMQMIYLNKALDTFNAAIVSPIYYVMYTTLTIVASAIMFKDWYGQSTDSIASEICGFITVLTGTVILHATREEEEGSSGRMRWQDSGKSFDEEHLTSLYSPEY